ncbi:MAG: hypothetical protein V3T45_07220 [Nitrospinaceae bacterium]
MERRADGFSVQCWYVKSKMKEFVKRDQPEGYATFKASDRWRLRFFDRFRLTIRATTNVTSHTVEDRLPRVRGFHHFLKEVQIPRIGTPPQCDCYGRWGACERFHVDQVPLEFGGLFNKTIDQIGTRRVHCTTPKIDVHRRWASLQLCFTAGNRPTIKPGICFRLAGKKLADGTRNNALPAHKDILLEHKALARKYPGVHIYYQPKAWFDTSTCMAFARRFVQQTKTLRRSANTELLLGCDNLTGQSAPEFRKLLWEKCNTLIAFTPPHCTDLCAVTDSHLGRAIKFRMKQQAKVDFDLRPKEYPFTTNGFSDFFLKCEK